MTSHTPGPWRVRINDCGQFAGWPSIDAGNDPAKNIDGGDSSAIVHRAGFIQEHFQDLGRKESIANAHLIAAAPEMLETLRNLVGVLDMVSPDYEHDSQEWAASHVASECVKCILDEHIKTGSAAIAKAEGKV